MKGWIKKMATNFGWYDPRGMYNAGGLLGNSAGQLANQAQAGNYITQAQAAQLQQQHAMVQAQMQNAYAQSQAKEPKRTMLGDYQLELSKTWTFEELNDEGSVYNMPLQTAVDLAINKFGSGWFKDEATADALEENTEFWLSLLHKLYSNKRLLRENCRMPDSLGAIVAWKILDTDHGNS